MEFDDLTQVQKEKFRACKTPEEMAALAEEGGVSLSIDELDEASGGRSGFGFCNYHGYPGGRRC